MPKLPIALTSFSKLRGNNFLYIDKTHQLEHLIDSGLTFFLSRPNGFGKSLMLSTIAAIFSGQTELFKNLAAEKLVSKFEKKPHPILYFDLAQINVQDYNCLENSFQTILQNAAQKFDLEFKNLAKLTISTVIETIYHKFASPVILIDNYHQPIINCLDNSKLLKSLYYKLRLFYDAITSSDDYTYFTLITGCEKYNYSGIFSTIHNIYDISSSSDYADILGYTQKELEDNFAYFIERNAKNVGLNIPDYLNLLKDQCPQFCFDGNTNVYNPSSIIQFLTQNNSNKHFSYINKNQSNRIKVYTTINHGDTSFLADRADKFYVDKSNLLIHTNDLINSSDKYICISRPRRFGKTISVNMVAAYYDLTANAQKTFFGLKITHDKSFLTFANKYILIKLNIADYLSKTHNIDSLLKNIIHDVTSDLLKQYGYEHPENDLNNLMASITSATGLQFIIVVDEWDCILRELKNKKDEQRIYLDFLRYWFKDKHHIALVYMAGILPIKKYGTHSALNMFKEYSMLKAYQFSEFVGFIEPEVRKLCQIYNRDFDACKIWYDGYQIQNFTSIYNPRSVNQYIRSGDLDTYWNKTETYEALQDYIFIEKYGLRDIIINLLANDSVRIDPNKFTNDMTTFKSHDDVLTLLVHLGYLSYDATTSSVRIPNQEVAREFITSINTDGGWPIIVEAITNSAKLLEAVFNGDTHAVASGIQKAHLETSILQYNDENALAYTIYLAFYAAQEKYTIVREFPTGLGFADLLFLPREKCMEPILLIELKWNKSADSAINQIHKRQYPNSLKNRSCPITLVGINYDKKSKEHTCIIEKIYL